MAIGSILNHAKHNMVIWGTGIHDYHSQIPKVKFDIRAVRGPITKEILEQHHIKCPDILGDPAILLPEIYYPKLKKTKDYVIIPHFSKEVKYINKYNNVLSTLISDWKTFINSILESKLVISSSLHGIILAEAYGIPAILLNDIDQDFLKYNDYYYSTNRKNYKIANSIEEALKTEPEKLPDFSLMRQNLKNSFPYDLWE